MFLKALHFPLRGITFLLRRPRLWCLVLIPLLLSMIVAIALTISIFTLALHPQAHFVAQWSWIPVWLAYIVAVLLCLIEIAFGTLLFHDILNPCFVERLVVAAIKDRQCDYLLPSPDQQPCHCPIISEICRWITPVKLLVFIITFPINFIPILGTCLFFLINAPFEAWDLHSYYFDLKDIPFTSQAHFIRHRYTEYVAFGLMAMLLQSIPVISMLFACTNAVGAVLWACDWERGSTAPSREQLWDVEQVPQLRDLPDIDTLPVQK